jgi:hypothetical protein
MVAFGWNQAFIKARFFGFHCQSDLNEIVINLHRPSLLFGSHVRYWHKADITIVLNNDDSLTARMHDDQIAAGFIAAIQRCGDVLTARPALRNVGFVSARGESAHTSTKHCSITA